MSKKQVEAWAVLEWGTDNILSDPIEENLILYSTRDEAIESKGPISEEDDVCKIVKVKIEYDLDKIETIEFKSNVVKFHDEENFEQEK